MKKLLFILTLAGCGILTANAQYYDYNGYDYGSYSYDTLYNTTAYANTSYSNYYPQTYSGNNYGTNYSNYNGGIGSYTIGCTTYYYNTRTGSQLYTSYICSNYTTPSAYQYQTNYQYQQPTYYQTQTYPVTSYPSYPSQYQTYGYNNGTWYPGYSHSILSGTSNTYQSCYYNSYGQYLCY